MLVFQPTIEEDTVEVSNVSELDDRFLSFSELDNSLPIIITVTASDRVGQRNGNTSVHILLGFKGSQEIFTYYPR